MGSTHDLLTPTIIARESLMHLRNNLVMGNRVHRAYESEFKKIGSSLLVRKPVKFKVTKARTRATSVVSEQSITLNVATQVHVSWTFHAVDLTLKIEEYAERYIKPAAIAIANQIDVDLCALYDDVWNEVWESTGFITPESFTVLGKAGQRLDEEAAPQEDRCVVLNPAAHWSMANALRSLYVTDVAGPAVKRGYLARIANFEIYMDQNIKVHTTGRFHDTGSTAALLLGTTTPASGTTLDIIHMRIVSSSGNPGLKIGDVFTVAGCYAVNPISGESTGTLRQFVVTADATNTATTTAAICVVQVQPDLISTGPYKTVDTIPAAGAAVTVVGTQTEPYPINMAFHKNAFALIMVPLVVPDAVKWASTATEDGYSCTIVKDYDINDYSEIIRLDVLYGVKTLYPELACRIRGAEG